MSKLATMKETRKRASLGGGSARKARYGPRVAASSRAARVLALDPQLVLAGATAAIAAAEIGYRTHESIAWLFAQAAVAGLALLHAWLAQERLRLVPVLVIVGSLAAAFVVVHLALGVEGDRDSSLVFRWQGNGVLRGDYPRSEYPVGAVLLFALEAWLGGGSTRTANAFLMVPFQLGIVTCVWLTRTQWSPWLATVIGFWPLNAFYWQYKFDLVPAALLALGGLLALRSRWVASGSALGLGAAVKWTPALAIVVLAVWLVSTRRARDAALHVATAGAVFAAIHLPFLVSAPDEVVAAYERQANRTITPESLWYLLLRPFDLARVRTHISVAAGAPEWADVAAAVLQVLAVAALAVAAWRTRRRAAAVALASLAPVVFLLTNRIFSPQFVLVLFAGWGIAAALVVRTRREQLVVGSSLCAAALANAFVYPFALPWYDLLWPVCSAVLFGIALALTPLLALRAASRGGE
jgi:hypothetical protein